MVADVLHRRWARRSYYPMNLLGYILAALVLALAVYLQSF